jgi:hypothetical protein
MEEMKHGIALEYTDEEEEEEEADDGYHYCCKEIEVLWN